MLPVILRIAASNALSAILLAIGVSVVSLLVARPALTRALWVLVLLKLFTPPLWTIPIDSLLARLPNDRNDRQAPAVSESELAPAVHLEEQSQGRLDGAADADNPPAKHEARSETIASAPIAGSSSILGSISAAAWIVVIWGAGTLGCLTALIVRVRRFLRSLRLAAPAPACVQRRCAALAARLGLRGSPGVWFVRSAFCPSLWAFSRPARILVPQQLWDRLEPTQQDSLLVHELAHLRRRDHWVRLLETAVTLVYWWHPVVWFARRRLHEAEEQCCDAWVLGILPAAGNSYAAALLETVDFISTAHPATPALASGLGEFTCLKRRIVMIQNGSVRKALTWSGAMAVFGLASLVLPVAPSFGQGEGPENPAVKEKQKVVELTLDPSDPSRPDVAKAIMQTQMEVAQLSAEMQKIHAALEQATARLHALQAAAQGDDGPAKGRFLERPVDVIYSDNLSEYTNRIEKSRPSSRADRLNRLEKQVNMILAEIKEMKGEQHDEHPGK
jgi:bla regulator protein blaR1